MPPKLNCVRCNNAATVYCKGCSSFSLCFACDERDHRTYRKPHVRYPIHKCMSCENSVALVLCSSCPIDCTKGLYGVYFCAGCLSYEHTTVMNDEHVVSTIFDEEVPDHACMDNDDDTAVTAPRFQNTVEIDYSVASSGLVASLSKSPSSSRPEVSDPEPSPPKPSIHDTSRPELSRPEASLPELSRPEASRPETSRPELSRPELSRPEASRPEASRPEASRPETSRPELSRPEASRPETSRPETSRPETSNHESSCPKTTSHEVPRPETSRPETSRPETSRPETSSHELSRPELSRPETSSHESSHLETTPPETSSLDRIESSEPPRGSSETLSESDRLKTFADIASAATAGSLSQSAHETSLTSPEAPARKIESPTRKTKSPVRKRPLTVIDDSRVSEGCEDNRDEDAEEAVVENSDLSDESDENYFDEMELTDGEISFFAALRSDPQVHGNATFFARMSYPPLLHQAHPESTSIPHKTRLLIRKAVYLGTRGVSGQHEAAQALKVVSRLIRPVKRTIKETESVSLQEVYFWRASDHSEVAKFPVGGWFTELAVTIGDIFGVGQFKAKISGKGYIFCGQSDLVAEAAWTYEQYINRMVWISRSQINNQNPSYLLGLARGYQKVVGSLRKLPILVDLQKAALQHAQLKLGQPTYNNAKVDNELYKQGLSRAEVDSEQVDFKRQRTQQ